MLIVLFCLAQKPSGQAAPVAQNTNGIGVGRPKVYDNRTLTLMLESLNESLRNVQFIDQKSLATALGFIQGFRSSEVVSNFSINTLPVPSVKQEGITTTGNAIATTGAPLPDTTKQTTTTERAAITPQPPSLDTLPAFSGFTPNYGENASDLLNDQVNLTYQIFNLQMLLERSLSDRLLSANNEPRRQAVLGFNVSIDPPRTAEDAAAVVEITLNLAPGKQATVDGLSLVSLMPQEKTYNAAALSTKSRAFGGAAVAKMIQVGYSERRRGQTFYLYRDNDTISYERMNGENPNQIIFGWIFRPVLGRRSVSPGLRQLFAIVALPSDDKRSDAIGEDDKRKDEDKSAVEESEILSAKVRTYWKKYDQDTMTSFEEKDANRAARFRYGFSLGLTRPEIFNKSRYDNYTSYDNIKVKPTAKYQDGLGPKVNKVWWVPVGAKSAVISALGNNFFSGTKVVMGDKSYSNSTDGLILKSNQAFDITTTLEALAASPGAIIGRYGPAVPLISSDAKGGTEYDGIKITNGEIGPSLSGNRSLEIHLYGLKGADPAAFSVDKLPKDPGGRVLSPIVSLNNNVIPLPYSFYEVSIPSPPHLVLQTSVPDSFLSNGGGVIKVTWPFLSDKWTATKRFYDPDSVFQVVRLTANTIVITTKDLLGFTKDITGETPASHCWHLRAGDKSIDLNSPNCTTGGTTSSSISENAVAVTLPEGIPDKVVLVAPEGAAFVLDVPKATAANPADQKPIALNQYDAIWIDLSVKDASKVVYVEAKQLRPKFKIPPASKEGELIKTIQVYTKEFTGEPGDVDLTILDKDDKVLNRVRFHISCQGCNNKGEKQ